MKLYIILIGLIFCCSSTIANSCYKTLGITTSKYRLIAINTIQKKNINIKTIDKKDEPNPISKLLKHTKMKKISENTTLYGVGVNYKVSNKVKLSLDILAKLNLKDSSSLIEDKTANLKIALAI